MCADQSVVVKCNRCGLETQRLAQENQRLRNAMLRARIYAGDNLPASKGLTIVAMLEKALEGKEQ